MGTMAWSRANPWCTGPARQLARDIAGIAGLHGGPCVVGWIAAVWNLHIKGRRYDFASRLSDKRLFPDGPRVFDGAAPAERLFGMPWRANVATLLMRETLGDLGLSPGSIMTYGALHAALEQHGMPVILRMYPDRPGLHYVTLYQSARKTGRQRAEEVRFYWQDHRRYSADYRGTNPGLARSGWQRLDGVQYQFEARRVVIN